MEKVNIVELKKRLFDKYSSYDIPKHVLEDIFNKVKDIPDETETFMSFKRQVDEYIVRQIQCENINMQIAVVENYKHLLTMIAKNKKYDLKKEELYWFYEEAIELLNKRYNKYELLSNNIINNMKYLIIKENNYLKNDSEIFDISFLKRYIDLYEIDSIEYATILGYSNNNFKEALNGNKKLDKFDMGVLCSLFGVDSYNNLKIFIKEKVDFFVKKEKLKEKAKQKELEEKKKIELLKEKKALLKTKEELKEQYKDHEQTLKIVVNGKTKYNLSFLKEYVFLYNLTLNEVSQKLHCGIGKVDDVLNGNLLINESIIDEIAYEFNSNDFEDLYIKTIKNIETKKVNIKENELKYKK